MGRFFQLSQATQTFREHCPGQCFHISVAGIGSPKQFVACVLLSESAPHHSAQKDIVAIHPGLLSASVCACLSRSSASLDQLLPSSAIQLPTPALNSPSVREFCLIAASTYRHSLGHCDLTPSRSLPAAASGLRYSSHTKV